MFHKKQFLGHHLRLVRCHCLHKRLLKETDNHQLKNKCNNHFLKTSSKRFYFCHVIIPACDFEEELARASSLVENKGLDESNRIPNSVVLKEKDSLSCVVTHLHGKTNKFYYT